MIYSDPMNDTAQNVDTATLDTWRPFRGPFVRWPRLADAVLALLSFFLTIAIWGGERPEDDPSLALSAFVFFVAGNASLYWRRRQPERVHGVILAASALAMLFGHLEGPIFALAISLYNLGRYTVDQRSSAIGLIAAYALLIISELAFHELSSDDVITLLLLPFVSWYAGRRVRGRGEYLRLLQERAEQLEREQLVEAERAVAAERTRIARELHDIVAHQVSLMTVQAGAAKTVVQEDPQAAAKAMTSVEQAGRQALDELRHLLGVLRPGNESSEMGPQPGCADLPRLVEEVERAGLQVSMALDTGPRQLPARTELAIYRIVQETLTNVLKHAGPDAHAQVRIGIEGGDVTIEIKDNGVGTSRLAGSGHGIAGMRERAQLLGGSVAAGSRPGGGFEVIARLPLAEETV
jgi:signal transduction histidine kinase